MLLAAYYSLPKRVYASYIVANPLQAINPSVLLIPAH